MPRRRDALLIGWFTPILLAVVGVGPAATEPSAPRLPPRVTMLDNGSEAEPIILELRLGRLVARTVGAYRLEDDALIPLTQFLAMSEVRFRVGNDARLDATFEPTGKTLTVDPVRFKIQVDSRSVQTGPTQLFYVNGEYFIATGLLGGLLGARFEVNWSELLVTMVDADMLPVAHRLKREAVRTALLRETSGVEPDSALGPKRDRLGGLVVDYSWILPGDDPFAGSVYRIGAGTNAFGGSLRVSAASEGEAATSDVLVNGSWSGVWRDNPWLKQLRLGDALATGPRTRALRGISVTNSPYIRSSTLGTVVYDVRLEPGWQVEAYKEGHLVAFDSVGPGGLYGVELPVTYGVNPVDLVAYGPFGEVRRFNRMFRVSRGLLSDGQVEYGVAAGACRGLRCNGTINADVRYGVNERLTFRGGTDHFWRDSLSALTHPYLAFTASPANAWTLEVEGVYDAFGRAMIHYEPTMDLRLAAQYTDYAESTTAPLLTASGQRSSLTFQGFYRPTTENRSQYVEGTLTRSRSTVGTVTQARVGAATRAHGVQLLPYVRWEWQGHDQEPSSSRAFAGVTAFLAPHPGWGPVLGTLWIRTAFEVESSLSPTRAQITLARSFGPSTRVEAGLRWQDRGRGATLSLALTSDLASVQSSTAITAPIGGKIGGYQALRGSAVWNDATGRFSFIPRFSLDRGGISGRVFVDENVNGLPDPGERGVAGVRVLIGTSMATTDSMGRYDQWDLVPFEPVMLEIDSLSLRNPLLVPRFPAVSIVPGPNSYRVLDVALVEAGVIEGNAYRVVDGTRRSPGTIMLVLTNVATGKQREVATFSDGEYYLMGVKPGEYEIAVSPGTLAALRAESEPVRLTVRAVPGGDMLSGVELVLQEHVD